MVIISSREFREKQKKYLDLVDKNERVIVQRGKNKAYVLTSITETDFYFSDPGILDHMKHSIAQAERGEVTRVEKKDISDLLGL